MNIYAVVEISSIDPSILKGVVSIEYDNGHPLDEPKKKVFYARTPTSYSKSVGLVKSTKWEPELSSYPEPSIVELEALYKAHTKILFKDQVKKNPLAEFFK